MEKIKAHAGFSQRAAEITYDVHRFTGRVSIEPESLAKETPPVEEMYTNRFLE